MRIPTTRPRLVFVTNTPTPYRIAFQNALAEVSSDRGIELQVLYCAEREPHRHWDIDWDAQRYAWKVMWGVHPRLPGLVPHVNPGVAPTLLRLRPRWLLVAGAWNTPTMLVAASSLVSPGAARIFWSEGHDRAVLHPSGPIARLRRHALRRFDAFAVPNRASAEFALRSSGKDAPILPLPNTVDEDFFGAARDLDQAAVRAELGLPPHATVLLTIAQLEDRKGVSELVEAYGALPADLREKSVLVLAGTGSLAEVLTARARTIRPGEVRMLGHVSQQEVRRWLAASDAFVLPTKLDPNPLTVIEAAFAGRALLVSSHAGNVRELVAEDRSGFVIDQVEPDLIRQTLERAIRAGRGELSRLGAGAAEIAREGFARRSVAARFLDAMLEHFPREPA